MVLLHFEVEVVPLSKPNKAEQLITFDCIHCGTFTPTRASSTLLMLGIPNMMPFYNLGDV